MSVDDRKVLEAVLFLSDEPVPTSSLSELLERPRGEVDALLDELARTLEEEGRGFVLRSSAAGWRLYTSPDCAPWLERFVLRHRRARLSPAALEVLALIAYRGPIARAQIAELRGVDSDGVVKTLADRGLIAEAGRAGGPGTPMLFTVSPEFLERMGLKSLADLPPLAGFMPDVEAVEDMEAKLSPGA